MIIEPKTFKPKGGQSGRPRFRGLVQYMLRGKGTERCTWFMAGNLEGLDKREDAETAIKVVEAYQRRNSRAKRDKTYHLVISLHPDDRSLNEREQELVVRRAVQAAGLQEHHYIAVRHSDQEHEHLHVAVSKIHPRTLKIHHPWKDIEKFQALASELEQELGLHRVDRFRDRERTGRSYASRQFESARGEQSFARWAREGIGEPLELDRIANWQELHARLAAHGVRLVPRGNGLAVVDTKRDTLHCKASALGRQWSKQNLVERFGSFQCGPGVERVGRTGRERYEPKPLEPLRDDGLWHEYQRERIAMRLKRAEAREEIAARIKRERDAHRSRLKLRHHAIQALPIAAKDKRTLYKTLAAEREAAERALRLSVKAWKTGAQYPKCRTWKSFLAERAAHGDPRALRRLTRKRAAPAIQIRSRRLVALPRADQTTSRGTRVHDVGRGARIRESAGLLELVGDPSPDVLAQLVGLAEKRFQGSHVRALGSQAVREELERLIRARGLRLLGEREHER